MFAAETPGWFLEHAWLVPLIPGIAFALIILVGIITNLNIFFRPTSLFNTLLMLALLAGGLGLVARSVRSYGLTEATERSDK